MNTDRKGYWYTDETIEHVTMLGESVIVTEVTPLRVERIVLCEDRVYQFCTEIVE